MAATFVVVPQWQGSGSTRAMRLVDGALAIAGDLPTAATTVVDIPLEAGDEQASGLARLSALQQVRANTRAVLQSAEDWVLTVGGDCGVELASIEHANEHNSGDMAVVWFDAHPDLNTPESSPSGAFTGMVLRALSGEGAAGLLPTTPIAAERMVLAGTRAIDDGEESYLESHGIRPIVIDQLSTPDALLAAIEATGAASVYLHVDLDVLDPAELASLSDPVPFGLSAVALVDLIRAVKQKHRLAGAGITCFSPASPEAATDELPTILRIIGALTE